LNAGRPLPRLSQRIALLGSTLLIAFIVSLGGAAWLIIRTEKNRAQEQLLEQELNSKANTIGRLIATIHGELREVARSSLLSTALVDSVGRDAYLIPYLQGLQRVYGVPALLVFVDFEGKEIARNGTSGVTTEDFQWIRDVMSDTAKPRASIVGTGDAASLRVIEPIFYSRTPLPEGALFYRIKLSNLTDGAGRLAPLPELREASRHHDAGQMLRIAEPPELAALDLAVALRRVQIPSLPAGDLLTLLVAATIIAAVLAVLATRRIATHLTQDLDKLSRFALDMSHDGLKGRGLATGDTQDVRQLADALNAMLERLRKQHRQLQDESEAKYGSLVENIPGAAFRCRAENEPELDYVSRGIEAITGFPASEFTTEPRRSYSALIHPDDRAIRHPATGHRVNVWEYRITAADGSERWVWERNQRRHVSGEEGDSLEGVLFDITERKRVEESLLRATRSAESASQAKSQFLATMSHELRTPLSGILGLAELLLTPDLSPATRVEHARTILQSGHVLLGQLNDILDLSRIEAGRMELRRVPFLPAQIASDVATLFSASAQGKHLEIRSSAGTPPDVAYLGDPIRLRQMLSNFVSNAIKFTDAGQVCIDVEEVSHAGETCLEFRVTDTGIGISHEKIGDLFAPFSQIDTSNTRRHGGSGLGLSIVQNLAQIMKGEAGVESRQGEGSRFWFRIPAERRSAQASAAGIEASGRYKLPSLDLSAGDTYANLPALDDVEILLVDDNAMIRKVIESMLKHAKVRCSAVSNGADAVQRATTGQRPQLILMDCQMPDMDGFESTAAIRDWERTHEKPRLPIVALTAAAFDEDRERCLAAGMDDFLAKPVSVRELLRVIATHLGPTST
jgi:PAS domain S-box-containing protein